jgi:hypothetical protein
MQQVLVMQAMSLMVSLHLHGHCLQPCQSFVLGRPQWLTLYLCVVACLVGVWFTYGVAWHELGLSVGSIEAMHAACLCGVQQFFVMKTVSLIVFIMQAAVAGLQTLHCLRMRPLQSFVLGRPQWPILWGM